MSVRKKAALMITFLIHLLGSAIRNLAPLTSTPTKFFSGNRQARPTVYSPFPQLRALKQSDLYSRKPQMPICLCEAPQPEDGQRNCCSTLSYCSMSANLDSLFFPNSTLSKRQPNPARSRNNPSPAFTTASISQSRKKPISSRLAFFWTYSQSSSTSMSTSTSPSVSSSR